ncbi:hypothetical protein Agub_g10820 [Astrephomene gubernaculifera]|uniref:Protein kinase domain-containing protein n=1 Tax=Astrephomene gubernaculifera TaxID=47775 RepID=A0AAD3DYD2_9CHLO|nr:hypothetical protein Agub_g10820 [Astrephomene gubernaculifera]
MAAAGPAAVTNRGADGVSRDQAIQERIEAAAQLNALLYSDVERHVSALDRAEQERDAWAAHAKDLAQKVVQLRKHIASLERAYTAATGQQPSSLMDITSDNADEDARQLAELLQLQTSAAPGLESDLGAGPGPGSAGSSTAVAPSQTLQQQRSTAAVLYPASQLSATAEVKAAQAAASPASAAEAGSGAGADAGSAATTSYISINPTPNQQRVLEGLVRRGQAMGWLIQQSEVTLGSVLGEGEFGVTYLGSWRHAAVAVKVVRLRHAAELTSFLREVESMSYIRHPHVVPFLGACLSAPDRLSLVSEYMPNGTLSDWLHPGGLPGPGSSSGGLLRPTPPLLERLRMAHQVALGMCALEGCRPAVLHRDLKPSNVYLDGGGAARLGDFGLSRRLLAEGRASLTGETGTYLYMAPEVIRHEVYDSKADVWSWGVLLSECITCAMPYSHMYMTPVQVAMAVSEEHLAPSVPSNVHEEVQLVLRLSCQFDPEMRPDFASLADMLGAAIKRMEVQQAARPTLLSSIQASLLGGWSSAWGSGTSYPKQHQRQQQPQQQQQRAKQQTPQLEGQTRGTRVAAGPAS